jgi:hypothetical protein
MLGAATDLNGMPKKSKSDPQAVNAYLATLPKAEREALARLRTLIKETIPQVEGRVSYGTTVMFSLGRDLVGFVSQPKHLSFFAASPKLTQGDERRRDHQDPRGQRRDDPFLAPAPASGRFGEEDSSSTGPGECPDRQRSPMNGAPGWTRTSGPEIRSLVLYPTELRAPE